MMQLPETKKSMNYNISGERPIVLFQVVAVVACMASADMKFRHVFPDIRLTTER
jgi:hypothetical protein